MRGKNVLTKNATENTTARIIGLEESKMDIPICPHCGKTSETYRCGVAKGSMQKFYNSEGAVIMDEYDRMWFDMSDIIRCSKCNKIRKDLKIDDHYIVTND